MVRFLGRKLLRNDMIRVLIIGFLFVSCEKSVSSKKYCIQGRVLGCDYPYVYLKKNSYIDVENDLKVSVDTFYLDNGRFEFNGSFDKNQIVFLGFKGLKEEFPLVLEKNVDLILRCDSLYWSEVLEGVETLSLLRYNKNILNVRRNIGGFIEEKESILKNAILLRNDKLADSIRVALKEKMSLIDDLAIRQVNEEPDKYISLLLVNDLYFREKLDREFVEKWVLENNSSFLNYPIFDSIKNALDSE